MIAPFLLSFLIVPVLPTTGAKLSTPAGPKAEGPPGLVLIKGGRTYIGSTKEDIEDRLDGTKDFLRVFDAERPQNKERVEDFYYMVTEVTNEQYKAFVESTGYRAPRSWADGAVDAARKEFLKGEGEKRVAAREAGQAYTRKEFDSDRWWEANYQAAAWEMPADDALRPVGYTSHSDALAYCAWAGLRLPTEAEFQRAVRGDKKDPYTWGSEWKEGAAATNEIRNLEKAVVVGSLAEGKSRDGLYDLLGNVWEWTDSPYSPYDGFKRETYKLGQGKRKEKVEVAFHSWDANKRVSVGGSFESPPIAARATIRRETDREQRTNALGFRCAGTPRVGLDIARSVLEMQARRSDARVQGTEFVPETTLVTDRWDMRPSSSADAPENYAVILGYEYVLWMPVKTLEFNDTGKMARASRSEPVQLGFLSTSLPLADPELPAGTYFISYRGKGREIEDKEKEGEGGEEKGPSAERQDEEEVVEETGLEVNTRDENFLFYDAASGELVLTVEVNETKTIGVASMKFDKLKDGGSVGFVDEKVWETPADGGEPVQVVEKHLLVTGHVSNTVRARGLVFKMQLKPDQVMAKAEGWRQQ